ncbi:MAG: hypothetical protein Rhirs2KO_18500 [Rhizobiaceae bacterium]
MAITLYAARKINDHMNGIASWTMPSEIWLALHTGNPTRAGSVANEVSISGTGYGRIDLSGKLSAADVSTGICTLTGVINAGPALTDWGLLTHFSGHDAETGGNMLWFGEFSEAQQIVTAQQFQRVPGQLLINLL